MTPAELMAQARREDDTAAAFERIVGAARLSDLSVVEETVHAVCVCADGQHGPRDGFTCADLATARSEQVYTAASHIVERRRLTVTAPAVVIEP